MDVLGHLCQGRRFERDENEANLEEATSAISKSIQLSPADDEVLAKRFWQLGALLVLRFNHTGDPDAIRAAVTAQKKAVELATTAGSQSLPLYLEELGFSGIRLFMRCKVPADLEESISTLERAIELTPVDKTEAEALCSPLGRLGAALLLKHGLTHQLSDIQAAIDARKRVVDLTPESFEAYPARLSLLADALGHRFYKTGKIEDNDLEVAAREQVIEVSLESDPDLWRWYSYLGTTLHDRYVRTEKVEDIRRSIAKYQEAIRIANEDANVLPTLLNRLGHSLELSFLATDNPTEIEEAISAQRRAISMSHESDPNLPMLTHRLATLCKMKFGQTRQLADIHESATVMQRAIKLTPAEDASALGNRLAELASILEAQFVFASGETLDINEEIAAKEKAIANLPPGHITLPRYYRDLALSLNRRFNCAWDWKDIERALDLLEKAQELNGSEDLALHRAILDLLGHCLESKFTATLNIQDIDAAIDAKRRYLECIPEGHPSLGDGLWNLALTLEKHAQLTEELDDIAEAISLAQRSISLMLDTRLASLSRRYIDLGMLFTVKFYKSNNVDDLQDCIDAHVKAVEVLPEGHPDVAAGLLAIGDAHILRLRQTEDVEDIKMAVDRFRSAALLSTGLVWYRLEAARKWAEWANHIDLELSMEGYGKAIELLTMYVGMGQTMARRHENLRSELFDLPLSAAAIAFEGGRVETALEWLEEGRCLTWNQLNDLRTPLDDLLDVDEQLAKQILSVSQSLEVAGSQRDSTVLNVDALQATEVENNDSNLATHHIDLAMEWTRLVEAVRSKPGFEDFLKPTAFSSLIKDLPTSGSVIIINVDHVRCDAVVLRAGLDKPIHIPLPEFSSRKATIMRDQLRGKLERSDVRMRGQNERNDKEGKGEDEASEELEESSPTRDDRGIRPVRGRKGLGDLQQVLRNLWILVVKPILDGAEIPQSGTSKHHIWWCATGPLSFLPLHAAGDYKSETGATISDFAISSYIPNISTLLNRGKARRAFDESNSGVFLVSQPNTPGQVPIPGTMRERRAIEEELGDRKIRYLSLEAEAATTEVGIENMGRYTCIHFACHASQDPEPLSSGFFLYNGRLELSTIIKSNLKSADLAFLSACQTSTGDESLSDEAVHLAAGMLAAGYRGVIATMWSIKDKYAPEIARSFYRELLRLTRDHGVEGINGLCAAEALHCARQELRQELGDSEDALMTWIPYVHFGL
ncbi:hypothetical protein H1R20_g4386, partial [Candolleomyces eurysporus]